MYNFMLLLNNYFSLKINLFLGTTEFLELILLSILVMECRFFHLILLHNIIKRDMHHYYGTMKLSRLRKNMLGTMNIPQDQGQIMSHQLDKSIIVSIE